MSGVVKGRGAKHRDGKFAWNYIMGAPGVSTQDFLEQAISALAEADAEIVALGMLGVTAPVPCALYKQLPKKLLG
jgi:hypothetical protein